MVEFVKTEQFRSYAWEMEVEVSKTGLMVLSAKIEAA